MTTKSKKKKNTKHSNINKFATMGDWLTLKRCERECPTKHLYVQIQKKNCDVKENQYDNGKINFRKKNSPRHLKQTQKKKKL